MNGKTGLEHLTSLKEIKARPNLDILTEYQKWVDKKSDLAGLEGLPQDVGCAHPGFAPYLERIRCPKVHCVHPSKLPF